MANILVIYYAHTPHRATVRDHLYSFRTYLPGHRVVYLNLGIRKVPWHVKLMKFDLIIFHTIFLATHYDHGHFRRAIDRARYFAGVNTTKAILPQDEYVNSDGLCEFIRSFGITHVFTVSPESEWEKIYAGIDFSRIHFSTVLTGYLDERTLALIGRRADAVRTRDIDISYRAGGHRPWLGKHGLLKARIADVFEEKAAGRPLQVDLSTKPGDTIMGDRWYDFLLRSKYTIGVEGGASLLDKDISIRERTMQFMQEHPDASIDEIEAHCFPGMDGALRYFAISPRHLEACATRTCQILIEGEYNGILQQDMHYIPLKADFSNVDEVLDLVQRDELRHDIVERAYRDIVQSGRYTYQAFVQHIEQAAIGEKKNGGQSLFDVAINFILFRIGCMDDHFSNLMIAGNEFINALFKISPPDSIFKRIKNIIHF